MSSALARLQPSRLHDQRELMRDDVDVTSLKLLLRGKGSREIIEAVTALPIERTIEGASTVTVTVDDTDKQLRRSGMLVKGVDVNLDGLWFRLVGVEATGPTLTLTFEDREIAVLRSYPKPGAANNGKKIVDASKTTRVAFAKWLVEDVAKELKIPFRTGPTGRRQLTKTAIAAAQTPTAPSSALASRTERDADRDFGFADGEKLTVKGQRADRSQLSNLDQILQVGASMVLPRKLLVCAVMTVIQESTARNLLGGDLDSVGLFQQRASWGSYAERHDPATAAGKFYDEAVKVNRSQPGLDYGALCQAVQRSAFPDAYAQWRDEAEKIVSAWGVQWSGARDDEHNPERTAAELKLVDEPDTSHAFTRGSPETRNGKQGWRRENNWDCLQRLAQEVRWRCFVVSGEVWFISEPDLFASRPRMRFSSDSPGVDDVDFDYKTGKRNGTVTVPCRISRWQAPPGSVALIYDEGPINGRWLVSSVERDAFDTAATVTLTKPTPVLPESQAPEHQQAGTNNTFPGKLADPNDPTADLSELRQTIVRVARKAAAEGSTFDYLQKRPMPPALFTSEARAGIDCSAFAHLVYKAARAPDPSGFGYNGNGYTGSVVAHGKRVPQPRPGDHVMFNPGGWGWPHHMGIYVGDGKLIEMGLSGVLELPVSQMKLPLLGYVDTIGDPGASSPAANPRAGTGPGERPG